jgi:hypothetical protein
MMAYKGILPSRDCAHLEDLNINTPLAEHYQDYAVGLGIKFPDRRDQEAQTTGSTDQGDVTYEIPGIHAMYKIDTPPGVGNHTPGFAQVSPLSGMKIDGVGCQVEGSASQDDY